MWKVFIEFSYTKVIHDNLMKAISKLEWAEKWVFGAKMESMGIGNYFKKLNWEGESSLRGPDGIS